MPYLIASELPPSPPGKDGWPWQQTPDALPKTMPDGDSWPSISVVTPSYNQGEFIEETIRSVLLQGYPNLEYVVIDGGSTDNSVDIIEKYGPWLTNWVSEPDRGQAHAINKGLAHTTGEIFNWINSDDLLAPNALSTIARTFRGSHGVAGTCVNFAAHGEERAIKTVRLTSQGLLQYKTAFKQPAVWLRREGIERCGGIHEKFHYVFDWDLLIRYLHMFPHMVYTDAILARFRLHQGSKTVSARMRFFEEQVLVLQRLLALDRFEGLHADCDRRQRTMAWWLELDRLMTNISLSPWSRAAGILQASCSDPAIRWSRRTLGAIRDSLLSREYGGL